MNQKIRRILLSISRLVPDRLYVKMKFRRSFHRPLNLKNPKTYNEKLQWLKLYDRNPIYIQLVDKYEAKQYIRDRVGEQYVVKTLGVWDTFDAIDFSSLPNQFVLKCTHDCGGLVICKDKKSLDLAESRSKINSSLKTNYYLTCREWPYKNVKRRIIAEEYLENSAVGELRDYKFFCFNGEVKALFVASSRQNETEETKFDFFDTDYRHLPIINGHPNSPTLPERPKKLDEMIRLAEILSRGFPHIRCDFYEIGDKVYVGELTLYHWGGLVPFEPQEWDERFGSWIRLPEKRIKKWGRQR